MPNKPQTEKAEARMHFKRWKAGIDLAPAHVELVKRYFPFMR